MRRTKREFIRFATTGMLIIVSVLGLGNIGYTSWIQTQRDTQNLTNVQTPNPTPQPVQPLNANVIFEDLPEGQDFPDDDPIESTPGYPLPGPIVFMAQGSSQQNEAIKSGTLYVKTSSSQTSSNFDLNEWLAKAYGVLDVNNDPASLLRSGLKILSYQRGPLVDELGLKFLQKASSIDTFSVPTSNSYAVQQLLTNGLSQQTLELFQNTYSRSLRAGENDENSIASRNLKLYEAVNSDSDSKIADGLSKQQSGTITNEDRLRLVQYLIFSNKLDEAQLQLGKVPFSSALSISIRMLQATLLKKKKDFGGAASLLRDVISSLQSTGKITEEELSGLKREASILEENAYAASGGGKSAAADSKTLIYASDAQERKTNSLRDEVKPVLWKVVPRPVFNAKITVRAKTINPYYFTGINGVRFYGYYSNNPLVNQYNVISNAPFLIFRRATRIYAPADTPTLWGHCASHSNLSPNPTCSILQHSANKNVRISWYFF